MVLRVLVVDDEEDMRVLVARVVTSGRPGVEIVDQVGTGEEALESWERHRPDLIVLDQRMPGLTGLEVAAQVLEQHPEQRIVLFSAFLTTEMRAEATRLGVSRCVSKDDIGRLRSVVDELGMSA